MNERGELGACTPRRLRENLSSCRSDHDNSNWYDTITYLASRDS
jgi:hypothetical protein